MRDPTTKAERETWKAQAEEGQNVVEGVHDEIFLRLIMHVEVLEAALDAALEFINALEQFRARN